MDTDIKSQDVGKLVIGIIIWIVGGMALFAFLDVVTNGNLLAVIPILVWIVAGFFCIERFSYSSS